MNHCFVVMPFRAELHYLYLYMKRHIETTFGVTCSRGDAKILTIPLLDKIRQEIQEADVIIADCSGRNPNVFYELGMAHVLNKPVVLITGDAIEEAPTDVRAFEFIRYSLDDEVTFFERLDRALRPLLGKQYGEFYRRACDLLDEFQRVKNIQINRVSQEEFTTAALAKAQYSPPPHVSDDRGFAKFYLPIVIRGPADLDVNVAIASWIDEKFAPPAPAPIRPEPA